MPSTRPQRSRRSSATASMSSGLLTSSSSTSGTGSSLAAERSVMRLARPNPVRTISAPATCSCLATSYAIDSRLMTPVIRSFLPCRELTAGSILQGNRKIPGPAQQSAGPGGVLRGLQAEHGVVPAEAERRRDRDRGLAVDVQRLGRTGHVVEVEPLAGVLEPERRRSDPVAQGEDRRDRLHGT